MDQYMGLSGNRLRSVEHCAVQCKRVIWLRRMVRERRWSQTSILLCSHSPLKLCSGLSVSLISLMLWECKYEYLSGLLFSLNWCYV
jgi:hypothetical protein